MLRTTPEMQATGDVMTINFGPNHPSTHGVLRLIVDLYGEDVTGLEAVVGYLHTGFEKNMEQKTWWKCITYPERIDYVSFQNNEYVFVGAVEKMLELEVPPKAIWMRTLLCELNRIHSHLVWIGTSALELGAISMFWYAFRERDQILDLFELVTGYRMHTRYFQVGGLAEDIPRGFYPEARKFCDWMPKAVDDYETLLTRNKIWLERTEGHRAALGRRRDRARAVRPGAARVGRRLGHPPQRAVPRLPPGRLPRARLPGGRRLRALPRAHAGDARVGAHRRAVPRPARADGRRAVDRRRPQGRAAAARTSCTPRWSR